MSIIITLEGADWAEIVSQARQIIGEGQYLDLRTPAEAPKPRATRTKATAPAGLVPATVSGVLLPADPSPRGGAGGGQLAPVLTADVSGGGAVVRLPAVQVSVDEPAPEPVFESTVTTRAAVSAAERGELTRFESVDALLADLNEPESGSATTASEPITYEDMSREVLALAKEKGPDAVKAVLSTFGLTSARGTPAEMWPQIIAAVRSAM